MLFLPLSAAVGASLGWASGIVLAQDPARRLGAFEFTRVQLLACAAILCAGCSALGLWPTVAWQHWPAFAASILIGIILGNLAMIECLRLGGPRRTEVLLALKAPLVAGMAFLAFGETLSVLDLFGASLVLAGVMMAILQGGNPHSDSERLVGTQVKVVILGLLAAGFQGFGFLVMKPAMLAGTDPIAASAIRLSGAAFAVSLVALWPSPVFRSTTEMSPGLLFRTILPGFIGYGLSSTLLLFAYAHLDAGIAAILGSLSPLLVLPVIWLKEGHRPRAVAFVGAGLTIIGAAVIVLAG